MVTCYVSFQVTTQSSSEPLLSPSNELSTSTLSSFSSSSPSCPQILIHQEGCTKRGKVTKTHLTFFRQKDAETQLIDTWLLSFHSREHKSVPLGAGWIPLITRVVMCLSLLRRRRVESLPLPAKQHTMSQSVNEWRPRRQEYFLRPKGSAPVLTFMYSLRVLLSSLKRTGDFNFGERFQPQAKCST